MPHQCPLCAHKGTIFYQYKKRLYYECSHCQGIFMDKNLLLTAADEVARYEQHNNDVENKHYQAFVSPISNAILHDFSPKHKGLDFGAGTGPVISKLLEEQNFQIEQYDPYFHNYPDLLTRQYDYIACCEVMEHFHQPKKEFDLLKQLLHPNGKLYCMTDLYDESMDFHKWYYKNDPTHIFMYQTATIHWIQSVVGFSKVTIEGRLITFFS